jgi:hypothetical protein
MDIYAVFILIAAAFAIGWWCGWNFCVEMQKEQKEIDQEAKERIACMRRHPAGSRRT